LQRHLTFVCTCDPPASGRRQGFSRGLAQKQSATMGQAGG